MNQPINNIEQDWKDFESKVISPAAPDIQRREMRRAFYADIYILLMKLKDMSDIPQEAAVKILESSEEEVVNFFTEIVECREK